MKIEVKLKGSEEIARKIREYRDKYLEALGAALYQEGFEIWKEAVQRCPVETGLLRSSAYVAPPVDPKSPKVEVGFGTNYAIAVHERMDVEHPRGGEAKFLEHAVDQATPGMLGRLAERTEKNVASGTGVTILPAPTEPRA